MVTSTGPRRTKKYTPSSMNSNARSVPNLYGRRMYEVMAAWQTMPTQILPTQTLPTQILRTRILPTDDQQSFIADFANIWRAADKVVYSKTLKTASTPRTRIEQHFASKAVQRMKASATRDLAVGGPTLAAHAFKAGLVDACHLFIPPNHCGEW